MKPEDLSIRRRLDQRVREFGKKKGKDFCVVVSINKNQSDIN